MSDVTCPYCGEGRDICHDDGYGYDEDKVFEQTCGSCEKNFAFTTRMSFDYDAREADCLNGSAHRGGEMKVIALLLLMSAAALAERAYTVAEIDELREVLDHRYCYGSSYMPPPKPTPTARGSSAVWYSTSYVSRPYTDTEKNTAVELQLRTYMMFGKTAQAILAEDKARYEKSIAKEVK